MEDPHGSAISLSSWLAYGVQRVPALADALTTGDGASRGVHIAKLERHKTVGEEPRLFDYVGARSRVLLRGANAPHR